MCGVSRFKICNYELGGGSLNTDEQSRIREALHAEAQRLRNISSGIECGPPSAGEPPMEVG